MYFQRQLELYINISKVYSDIESNENKLMSVNPLALFVNVHINCRKKLFYHSVFWASISFKKT